MCGIFCTISRDGYLSPGSNATCLLQHRGPDSLQEHRLTLKSQAARDVYLSFSSSVLSLRGKTIISQPLVDPESGNVFCWNGEAWKILGNIIPENDSVALFRHLSEAATGPESQSRILQILEHTRGPFAFVFYNGATKRLYFGRDCLGRRSLLRTTTITGTVVISSVCDLTLTMPWNEIEADGIHVLDLAAPASSDLATFDTFVEQIVPFVYKSAVDSPTDQPSLGLPYPRLNKSIPENTASQLSIQSPALNAFESILAQSMELRVKNIRELDNHSTLGLIYHEARVAILFSGGLDCTLLARLAHESLPSNEPIDLLNVAFENPRIHKTELPPYELCPDRITGRSSFTELQKVCPGRDFRLVCINVPYTEFQSHRQTVIDLIYPHNTEMDLSIGCALYFASRGRGKMSSDASEPEVTTSYTTPARVLLSGLGADELFGGYHRLALAFSRDGYQGLLDDLELDINRLGKRNLGRDDRVISHWGKEARYPFLDEDMVAWALQAPIWEKVGFGIEAKNGTKLVDANGNEVEIEPGKLLLRLLAWKLGMTAVAQEKKRAIQFGARTAKMETGKTKGTTLLS